MPAWWVIIAAAVALTAVSFVLMPRPKAPRPEAVKDLEDPTAEAGRPIPVIFGTGTVKGLNVLAYMDKAYRTYKIDV